MAKKISNSDMRVHVQQRDVFTNHNSTVEAYWKADNRGDMRYVVYSYGDHFPMYIYDERLSQWFGNRDRYSVTTSRHQSQCMPVVRDDITWLETHWMQRLVGYGYDELVRQRLLGLIA